MGAITLLAYVMRDFKTPVRRTTLPSDLVVNWDAIFSGTLAPALRKFHSSAMMQHSTYAEQRIMFDMLRATELETVSKSNMLSCRGFLGSMVEEPDDTKANVKE